MAQYFTTRYGAIRRLMEVRRETARMNLVPPTIIGYRTTGVEVSGVEGVLLDVRAGRITSFTHKDSAEDQIVFIS